MGKKTADRIRRTKKRAAQLVTDPAAAMSDLEKHVQKTVGRQINTTKKNIDKSQKAVKDTFTTLVTSTGRYINLHKNELAVGATSFAVGMTMKDVARMFVPSNKSQTEIKYKGMGFKEYLDTANNNQDNLTSEDWNNLVYQSSIRLEGQIRLILNLSIEEKYNLNKLLELAEEKEVFESDELRKLHQFRKYIRNPIFHAQKTEVENFGLAIWTANFVKNLEEEKITSIN